MLRNKQWCCTLYHDNFMFPNFSGVLAHDERAIGRACSTEANSRG